MFIKSPDPGFCVSQPLDFFHNNINLLWLLEVVDNNRKERYIGVFLGCFY